MTKKRFLRSIIFSAAIIVLGVGAALYAKININKTIMTDANANNKKIIVLDAGHGGLDGGCSTADGKTEKVINLNVVLTTKDMLNFFGYEVETTRDKDTSIHDKDVKGIRNQKISDMDNRLEIFNMYPNSVCVSIHQNTYSDPRYSGAQMFYSDSNENNQRFASIMQNKFVEMIQPENKRETKLCGSELFLCYYCSNPTVMIECGFLSNPDEAAKLTSEEYQRKVAFTVFSGISEFLQE